MSTAEQPWRASLTVRGVDVSLGGNPILRGIDLDVVPGEVLALVGPNGAGKSTLLSVLAGDLAPDAGTVEIAGQSVHAMSAAALAQHRGVLQQRQTLAFGFRAREVVEMGRAVWRRTDRALADAAVVEKSMAIADVTHLSDRVVPTLSGGEQARVSFARLLAQETEVQFLDEPTAALDIKHQEAVLAQARASAEAGAAVVVVLHDLSLAAAWAHRICVLSAGQLRAVGTPAEVVTSELLSEVYEHPVHVIEHGGSLVVVPVRGVPTPTEPEEAPWPAHS